MPSIAAALRRAGHEVAALVRSVEKGRRVDAHGAEAVIGTLESPPTYAEAARAAGAIVHAAAEVGPRMGEVERIAVDALIEAAAAGGRRLTYTSGVWVLGDTGGRVVEAGALPAGAVAWRPAMEERVLSAAARGVAACVIRPGCVYGGAQGLIGGLLLAEPGVVRIVGEGRNHWALVYLDDLADLHVRAVERAPAGAVLNATDDSRLRLRDIAEALAAAAGRVPSEVFRRMGELGFFGIDYGEDVGGAGLDYWYVVAFAEELTRARSGGLNTSILVHCQMATPVIEQVGSEYVRKTFLPGMISGEKIFGLGVTEPGAGSDVAAIRTTARRDGDDYVIDGAKTWISNGGIADFITLLVKTDPSAGHRGMSLLVFPTDTPGFSVGRVLPKLGNHASNTAELSFDGCRVPARNLVGEEGKGFFYLMKNFQAERLIAAVNAVAAAERAWEDAFRYTSERHAFGQPIAHFQVWRHELVDLLIQIEAGRRLAYHACDLHDNGLEATREISMAKAFCGEMAIRVVDRCLQAHGGYGYSEEYPVARQYRDIRLATLGGGTTEIMKEIIARTIGLP